MGSHCNDYNQHNARRECELGQLAIHAVIDNHNQPWGGGQRSETNLLQCVMTTAGRVNNWFTYSLIIGNGSGSKSYNDDDEHWNMSKSTRTTYHARCLWPSSRRKGKEGCESQQELEIDYKQEGESVVISFGFKDGWELWNQQRPCATHKWPHSVHVPSPVNYIDW